MNDLSDTVRTMAGRGPQWAAWVAALPKLTREVTAQWQLSTEGPVSHGYCSLIVPVRTADGAAAVLKISYPDDESEHEHLALRRWAGDGAVRLLGADPHRRALLLERLDGRDLTTVSDVEAAAVVARLYRRIHVPAMPQLRALTSYLDRWNAELAQLPRSAPIPHRLVDQALAHSHDLAVDPPPLRVIHSDLHYANVLAAERDPWLAIDPKPVNGDPHYEIAPMLWNRWDELAGDIRAGVARRFYTLVDAAGLDEDRARAWVVVRMVHNAMWALRDGPHADPGWLTTCIALAKAVQL